MMKSARGEPIVCTGLKVARGGIGFTPRRSDRFVHQFEP